MNFDFITDCLAVGQKIDTAEFAEALQSAGITHVLNLFAGDRETFWSGPVCYLPQEDDGTPRNPEQVRAAVRYAFEVIGYGGKLYIHCQWGLGRAPSTCYAILRQLALSRELAVSLIKRKRPRCADWHWENYIPSIEEALSLKP